MSQRCRSYLTSIAAVALTAFFAVSVRGQQSLAASLRTSKSASRWRRTRRRSRAVWSSRSPRRAARAANAHLAAGPAVFGIDLDQLRPTRRPWSTSARSAIRVARRAAGRRLLRAGDRERLRAGASLRRQDDLGAHERRHASSSSDRAREISTATCAVHIGTDGGTVKITITHVIAPRSRRRRTPSGSSTSRSRARSSREFWGRPIYIHATVLLPKGYTEHPERVLSERLHARPRRTPLSFIDDATRARGLAQIRCNPCTGTREWLRFVQSVDVGRLSRASSPSASSSRRHTSPTRTR